MDHQATKLTGIFNEVDPAGIYFGDNHDEYTSEINELISLNPDFSNTDQLFTQLQTIFHKYFTGVTIHDEVLRQLVQKIKSAFSESDQVE